MLTKGNLLIRMAMVKRKLVNSARRWLNRLGVDLVRLSPCAEGPMVAQLLSRRRISSLEQISAAASPIPGMLSEEAGKILYLLCVSQMLNGDVVEIGSWQGYSTSFLARAVRDSRNGEFFAIDHFKGNRGTEDYYVVGKPDLSDLRNKFECNMRSLDLWEGIELLDMPNNKAAEQLVGRSVRFLFIDGDHTREGVEKDINLFFPMLKAGSIVVFDDFSDSAPGLVGAIDALLERQEVARSFSYRNTLAIVLA